MGNQRDRQFTLPKNIRQMGQFGDTYKIYVEDFVYTYVHRTLHMEKQEHEIAAAVLLGKTCRRNNQEYIFISGAQQVSFSEWGQADETDSMQHFTENDMTVLKSDAELNSKPNAEPDTGFDTQKEDAVYQTEETMYDVPVSAIASQERQQQFWEKVYQGIKEYFSDLELLGWYFNLDGDNLEISASMQQFFDATEEHGSKFLYFEDKLNRQDVFFVQEQHSLQRVEGYAVYYEKNPSMQEFLVAQNRHTEPPRVEGEGISAKREDVAQNYRAILNKLNEKPAKKKRQPFVYVAGVAVLAVVAATGITQVGNYQTLQQTLQTVSGNVQGKQDAKKTSSTDPKEVAKSGDEKNAGQTSEASSDGKQETGEQNTTQSGETSDAAQTASENASGKQGTDQNTDTKSDQSANQNTDTKADQGTTQNTDEKADQSTKKNTDQSQGNQSQNTQSQQTSAQDMRHYTVKKGDSLMSISKAIYHDTSMIDKICSMNQIENMDMIYEGQDLILP